MCQHATFVNRHAVSSSAADTQAGNKQSYKYCSLCVCRKWQACPR